MKQEQYIEYDERIDRYLRNQMDADELTAFEQEVVNDQELRERLVATAMLVKGIAQVGMQQEGQAQLDAIKQMNREEYIRATQGKKGRNPIWTFMKWASGIAAAAFIAYGLYTFNPRTSRQQPEMAEVVKKALVKPAKSEKPAEPTLADLADRYNKPFSSEPDIFADIREQIKKSGSKDMMAVVNDIDNVEWPTAKHGPKGGESEDEFKETLKNYEDCSHWYKALAYLKTNDKDSAVNELKELIDNGQIEELKERATELLGQLEK